MPPPDRQGEIGTRLDAVRARLKSLRERSRDLAASPTERLEAAQRREVQARDAAISALISSVHAFRTAAAAHERVASVRYRMAAQEIGDVREHEQKAARHRAAAQADLQRAERSESILSESEWARPAVVPDEPGTAVAP